MPEAPGCEEFGALLAGSRRARGLTQEDLAERSGLSVRAIRDLERGRVRSPQRRTTAILADALGLAGPERARFLAFANARRLARIAAGPAGLGEPAGAGPGREPGPEPMTTPGELPAATGDLAGRDHELAVVRAAAAEVHAGRRVGASVVSLYGPPGVGKTTLAVYAGHRVSGQFPDGQLFVDLRGIDDVPRAPRDVLAGFLRSLGVPDERIPASSSERAALYRSLTRDSRILVVLDNASDEAQLRPLLPAGTRCLVLITSRRPLAGLEAVRRLRVGLLAPEEGRAMLHAILGAERSEHEAELVDQLVGLCGQLPLALRIVGNRLASRPEWSVGHLVELLRDQRYRLTALTAGDLDVRAAFEISYQQLTGPARRMFRLAALLPGSDFGVELLAVIAELPVPRARLVVEEIVDAGLLVSTFDRYHFHDLIALFAGEQLGRDEPAERVAAARRRLVGWLLERTAECGAVFLPRSRQDGDERAHRRAADWLTAESANWLGAMRLGVRQGCHGEVVRAVLALHWYSDAVPQLHRWDEIFTLGVEAARRAGLRDREVTLLNFLGWALLNCRQRDVEALAAHREALAVAREIGERREEAWALTYTGWVHVHRGEPELALPLCRSAVQLFRDLGDPLGEHSALGKVGDALRATGEYAEALRTHRAVHDFYCHRSGLTSTGITMVEAIVLRAIGQDLAGLGRWDEAAESYGRARRLAAESGSPLNEALAAHCQGIALRELGRPEVARRCLHDAVALFTRLRHSWGRAQAGHALALLERDAGEPAAAVESRLRRALADCGDVSTAAARALAEEVAAALAGATGSSAGGGGRICR